NRQILTRGKQSKKFGTDEVTFDKDSRLDYLTGFHKRKLQRQKKAQEFIKEQERLRKIEERQKIRQERKEVMEEQLKTFKESLNLKFRYLTKNERRINQRKANDNK
uniref:Ribosomal RNA-processing protein 17 n=1 Tax=Saccharomyces cerevisiae BY4741 TaxID=1247190 RepID=UPI002240E3C8|nr:Chain 5, Ribosomal RNA-processing protein 17 [Saccharomyces cerevisiae BY4741]